MREKRPKGNEMTTLRLQIGEGHKPSPATGVGKANKPLEIANAQTNVHSQCTNKCTLAGKATLKSSLVQTLNNHFKVQFNSNNV